MYVLWSETELQFLTKLRTRSIFPLASRRVAGWCLANNKISQVCEQAPQPVFIIFPASLNPWCAKLVYTNSFRGGVGVYKGKGRGEELMGRWTVMGREGIREGERIMGMGKLKGRGRFNMKEKKLKKI